MDLPRMLEAPVWPMVGGGRRSGLARPRSRPASRTPA
jgi:hypothetical protein